MTFYHKMGILPAKRHTVFRKPDGTMYREQVIGTCGFSGNQATLYHLNDPISFKKMGKVYDLSPVYEEDPMVKYRLFNTFELKTDAESNDPIMGRNYVLANEDLKIATVAPEQEMNYFYRNSEGDEILFVHEGEGTVESIFGILPYKTGDYIIIPVGTTYRINMQTDSTRFLVIETQDEITIPKKYRNEFGQMLENSPYCERDIHPPSELITIDEKGEFEVRIKMNGKLTGYIQEQHPFDVVGWDGFLYPWTFNIADFLPITGQILQPPSVHQTFAGTGFVICSFVPRMLEYYPGAIKTPYFHSNVDSEEVLYYVNGNFHSRKGVDKGAITLHPMGLTHGPHPGVLEASLSVKETNEFAVMIDTFKPLRVTKKAVQCENEDYLYSWSQPQNS
ncbi:homogentisate 1,2-dioxygenase [Neobacillus niacini]|uniref:homogentisate 1,2-dioxygenase n=1 Tax=Neobacillus niacini TaxID=86668 RepID=UPI002FFEF161